TRAAAPQRSHFQDDGHDQGPTAGLPRDVALQIHANLLLHNAPIRLLLLVRAFQGLGHNLARGLDEFGAFACDSEAAADDLRQAFDTPGMAVDGDDGQHDAVFREMRAIAKHPVLHRVVDAAGIDASAAGRYSTGFARAVMVDLQNLAGIHHEGLFQPDVTKVLGEARVFRKLAELAVDRHEVTRPHEI